MTAHCARRGSGGSGAWRRTSAAAGLLAIGAVMGAIASTPATAGAQPPALFDSREIIFTSLDPFQKWRGVRDRLGAEGAACEGCAGWRRLLAGLEGAAPAVQLDRVNRFVNRARYVEDIVNYGVEDYWATPRELLVRGGDCEDFAIAKYAALRALGFPGDKLRLIFVEDTVRRLPHAALVAYVGGRALVLDNRFAEVVPAGDIAHYRPIYSLNETAWWLHRPGDTTPR